MRFLLSRFLNVHSSGQYFKVVVNVSQGNYPLGGRFASLSLICELF